MGNKLIKRVSTRVYCMAYEDIAKDFFSISEAYNVFNTVCKEKPTNYNYIVISNLLYWIFNTPTDTIDDYIRTLKHIEGKIPYVLNNQLRREMEKGNTVEIFNKAYSNYIKKNTGLWKEVNVLFIQSLMAIEHYCKIIEKYEDSVESRESIDEKLKTLYRSCFYEIVCAYASKEDEKARESENNEKTEEKKSNSFSKKSSSNSVTSEDLVKKVKNKEIDFTKLYSYCKDYDSNMLRELYVLESEMFYYLIGTNSFEDADKLPIEIFEDSVKDYDFSYLFKIVKENNIEVIGNTEIQDKSKEISRIVGCFLNKGNFENTVKEIIGVLISDYMGKVVLKNKDELSEIRLKFLNETKELKGMNRNLTKMVNKTNSEKESIEKELEKEKEKNQNISETSVNKEEVSGLETQIEKQKIEISEIQENLKKSENSLNWNQSRVKELEEKLKYYAGIERELAVLQNENNVLKADIDKIEYLESEEDEDDIAEKLEQIKDEPILFMGGTGDMFAKFMEIFPNSTYLNINDNMPNFNIPQHIKYVAIYTKVMKHCFCERAESLVDKSQIIYLNILNKELVIEEIYKKIVGHK